MASIKLKCFVVNAAATANEPGKPQNILRLHLAPKKPDAVDDPNAGVFPNANKGAFFEATGLSDEALAGFKGGQTATITIETD